MSDEHLTPELLAAVLDGEIAPRDLVRRVTDHLLTLCPTCSAAYESFRERQRDRLPTSSDLQLRLAALREWNRRLASAQAAAEAELADLLERPQEERIGRVRRARTRFRNPLLVEALIDLSRHRLRLDATEARHLAALASEVALALSFRTWGHELPCELHLRAVAHRANALRVAGDLHAASETLSLPLQQVHRLSDPRIRAEIWSLAASLRRDQRRFSEALELLAWTVRFHRRCGDATGEARALVKRAQVLREAGRPERAIPEVEAALRLLDADADPRLLLAARHDLATYLVESGHPEEARRVMADSAELYDRHPEPWTSLRRTWLEGKVALALGDAPRAETLLEEARHGFARERAFFDDALVTLDLALLRAHQGRFPEVRALALEVYLTFRLQGISRETLAALAVLRQAAERETVNEELVRELAAFLEAARRDPSLRFRDSGPTSPAIGP